MTTDPSNGAPPPADIKIGWIQNPAAPVNKTALFLKWWNLNHYPREWTQWAFDYFRAVNLLTSAPEMLLVACHFVATPRPGLLTPKKIREQNLYKFCQSALNTVGRGDDSEHLHHEMMEQAIKDGLLQAADLVTSDETEWLADHGGMIPIQVDGKTKYYHPLSGEELPESFKPRLGGTYRREITFFDGVSATEKGKVLMDRLLRTNESAPPALSPNPSDLEVLQWNKTTWRLLAEHAPECLKDVSFRSLIHRAQLLPDADAEPAVADFIYSLWNRIRRIYWTGPNTKRDFVGLVALNILTPRYGLDAVLLVAEAFRVGDRKQLYVDFEVDPGPATATVSIETPLPDAANLKEFRAIALGSGGVRLQFGGLSHDCRGRGGDLLALVVQSPGGAHWNKLRRDVVGSATSEALKKAVQYALKSAPADIKDAFKVTGYGVEISKEIIYVPLPQVKS